MQNVFCEDTNKNLEINIILNWSQQLCLKINTHMLVNA